VASGPVLSCCGLAAPCPHVLSVFNVSPAACIACVRYQPCCRDALKDTRRSQWEIMMVISPGIFAYFNTSHPVELHRARGGFGAVLSQEAGAEASGHVVAPKLSCARRWELAPRDT
jgi:hypothetical protein